MPQIVAFLAVDNCHLGKISVQDHFLASQHWTSRAMMDSSHFLHGTKVYLSVPVLVASQLHFHTELNFTNFYHISTSLVTAPPRCIFLIPLPMTGTFIRFLPISNYCLTLSCLIWIGVSWYGLHNSCSYPRKHTFGFREMMCYRSDKKVCYLHYSSP